MEFRETLCNICWRIHRPHLGGRLEIRNDILGNLLIVMAADQCNLSSIQANPGLPYAGCRMLNDAGSDMAFVHPLLCARTLPFILVVHRRRSLSL
jgi:hypothetical protein